MARVPDYTPYDHLGAAKQVGEAIGRIPQEAVGAYVGGKQMEQKLAAGKQKLEAGEVDIAQKKESILKDWRANKSLKKKKEIFKRDLETTLSKTPNDWAKRQFEYLDNATTNDEFDEVAGNITRMLQASQDYGKKYPYLSLSNPDPATAGAALGSKAADSYINSLDSVVENSHSNFINEAAKGLAADPTIKTSDEAVQRFADEHMQLEGAVLTPEADKMLKDAFSLTRQEQLAAQTAQTKAETSQVKAGTKSNLITNKTFIRESNEENKLYKQILAETNKNLRNTSNLGQFYDSEGYKKLSEDKKEMVGKLVERLQSSRDRKNILRAARTLNMSLDATQTENALADIMDDGMPSTPLHQQLLEQMKAQGDEIGTEKDPGEQEQVLDETSAPSPFGIKPFQDPGQQPAAPAPKPQKSPLSDEDFLNSLGI